MRKLDLLVGINGNRLDLEFATGGNDSTSNLTPIGNKNAVDSSGAVLLERQRSYPQRASRWICASLHGDV